MSLSSVKIAVIYKSKYGTTKRYAEWIAQEVHGELFEQSQISVEDLTNYNIIIYGGSLHAVGIKGVKLITANYEKLKDKKIIVFAVGASKGNVNDLTSVIEHNFKGEMKEKIPLFYCRGGFNFQTLSFLDKTLMSAMKKKIELSKKSDMDEETRQFLDSYEHPVDFTDKSYILPIIEEVKKYQETMSKR